MQRQMDDNKLTHHKQKSTKQKSKQLRRCSDTRRPSSAPVQLNDPITRRISQFNCGRRGSVRLQRKMSTHNQWINNHQLNIEGVMQRIQKASSTTWPSPLHDTQSRRSSPRIQ